MPHTLFYALRVNELGWSTDSDTLQINNWQLRVEKDTRSKPEIHKKMEIKIYVKK